MQKENFITHWHGKESETNITEINTNNGNPEPVNAHTSWSSSFPATQLLRGLTQLTLSIDEPLPAADVRAGELLLHLGQVLGVQDVKPARPQQLALVGKIEAVFVITLVYFY